MTHKIQQESIKKRLAKLAAPIFIETLLIMMLGAVDTIMLSRHSDNSVAAVGVVNQIIRTKLSNQVVENVKENLDTKIYETMIPRNIRLAEAPSYGIPINMYDSKSAGAESYRKLAKEIVGRKDL